MLHAGVATRQLSGSVWQPVHSNTATHPPLPVLDALDGKGGQEADACQGRDAHSDGREVHLQPHVRGAALLAGVRVRYLHLCT